ncbi:MAG: hypothetical protein COB53_08095 [Elusimicrobia bacterium]|nr:MAG: hypothetical protein COB53_08095 [Elusimicrobiota bacterium]
MAFLVFTAPVYAVFDDSEPDRIDAEIHFDREYFLDLRSFSAPMQWEREFSQYEGAKYFINGSSLDCCDLLIDQRLQFGKTLTDRISFAYTLDHLGTKDGESLFNWVAFDFKLGGGLTAGIFGEPKFAKQDADIGFKLAYEPIPDWYFAARVNAVDFNFNQRGVITQSYARKPATFDFNAVYSPGDDSFSASAEFDTPLIRLYPDEGRTYRYRKTSFVLQWQRYASDDWSWKLDYGYEFKREAEDFVPDAAGDSQDHHRRVHRLGAAFETALSHRDRLEAGMGFFVRGGRSDFKNQIAKSSRRKRWEWGPHARWRRTLNDWSVSELAFFLSTGENRRSRFAATTAEELETLIEAKIGTGIDLLFGPSAKIGIYATFDIDELTSNHWDGGSIRAMFLF